MYADELRVRRIRGGSRRREGHRLRVGGGEEAYLFLWPLLQGTNCMCEEARQLIEIEGLFNERELTIDIMYLNIMLRPS